MVSQQQIKALAEFRSALRRFLAFSEVAARESGVTTQQYQAILAVGARPDAELSVGELGKEMLLSPNSAVQLVDRLAAMGLVERSNMDGNRRSVRVFLTDAGRTLLERLASVHLAQIALRRKQLMNIVRQVRELPSSNAQPPSKGGPKIS